MSHWTFFYDQTRCVGCNACQMACKDKNNLEKSMFFRRVRTMEYERDGRTEWVHFSGGCNHCENPACAKACPTGAMSSMPDGTVGHDPGKCIGCGACTWACPYGAPKLSRRLGIARKCDSCRDLREQGKEPACVSACLTHCLRFADTDMLTESETEGYEKLDLPFLPDSAITGPTVRIKKKR